MKWLDKLLVKILDWFTPFGWMVKKEEAEAQPLIENSTTQKIVTKPFVIPNPAELYPPDTEYQPYTDVDLKEMFDQAKAPKEQVPLDEPVPSIDATVSRPKLEVKADISEVSDPMIKAALEELSKEQKAAELSSKRRAPRKKDPTVVAVANTLTKTMPSKKKVAPPTKKATTKKAPKTKSKK